MAAAEEGRSNPRPEAPHCSVGREESAEERRPPPREVNMAEDEDERAAVPVLLHPQEVEGVLQADDTGHR